MEYLANLQLTEKERESRAKECLQYAGMEKEKFMNLA